jgi:hypothetical protein
MTGAPELAFTVLGVAPERPAAAPTLRFSLGIDAGGAACAPVMLEIQLRIAATQRGYDEAEQALLAELFGEPHRWADTLRGLLWTQATLVVPPFDGSTVADLYVPCTYDFDVAAAKYLAGPGRRRRPARAVVQRDRLLRGARRRAAGEPDLVGGGGRLPAARPRVARGDRRPLPAQRLAAPGPRRVRPAGRVQGVAHAAQLGGRARCPAEAADAP